MEERVYVELTKEAKSEDKVTVILTNEANAIADQIALLGFFEDKMDIAKFAFAYAVKHELDKQVSNISIGEGRGASWNIGSLDADQYLVSVVKTLFPDVEAPYRLIELLMNVGLISLGKVIEENGLSGISEFL
jgi:hypothetical protein